MVHYIDFPLADGETIRIEVDAAGAGTTRAADVVSKASETLEAALDRLKPTVSALMGVMRELGPEEVAVEFGFKANADSGVVIAKAGAEANFKVSLKWKNS